MTINEAVNTVVDFIYAMKKRDVRYHNYLLGVTDLEELHLIARMRDGLERACVSVLDELPDPADRRTALGIIARIEI